MRDISPLISLLFFYGLLSDRFFVYSKAHPPVAETADGGGGGGGGCRTGI